MFVSRGTVGSGRTARGIAKPDLPPGLAARARPVSTAAARLLPVAVPLIPLFPDRAVRRGSATVVTGEEGMGATTLALALLAAASTQGSWCGIVGLEDPGVVAMAELGIDLDHLVLVPRPQARWAEAVGELAGGVDAILVRPPGRCRPALARRVAARCRERRTALVVLVSGTVAWPEPPDLALRVVASAWHGAGTGHGHLQARLAEVEAVGRRSADRPVIRRLWLPARTGSVADVADPVALDGPAGTGGLVDLAVGS